MSIVEILTAMYSVANIGKILSHADDRDRIIVSKGHAAAATYAVMHEFGLLDRKDLLSYHHKGSKLQGHRGGWHQRLARARLPGLHAQVRQRAWPL